MRALRTISSLLILVTGACLLCLPVTDGPLAYQANAKAKCGGLNQKACKIHERPGKPCDKGLVERTTDYFDPDAGRCVRPSSNNRGTIIDSVRDAANAGISTAHEVTKVPAALARSATGAGREFAPLATQINRTWLGCAASIPVNADPLSQAFIDQITATSCFRQTMEMARSNGFRTLSIGLYAEAALLAGSQVEDGIAFDVHGQYAPTRFRTTANEYMSVGAGLGVSVGLHRGTNQPGSGGFGGSAEGISGAANIGGGGSFVLFFNGNTVSSLTISVGKGLGIDVAYVKSYTSVQAANYRMPRASHSFEGRPPDYDDYDAAYPDPEYYPLDPTIVRVCNRSGEDFLYSALAYWDKGNAIRPAGWKSQGWWELRDNACADVKLPKDETGGPYGGEVYMMATAEFSDWPLTDAQFCVDRDDRFTFRNADMKACDRKSDMLLGSKEFIVEPGAINTFTFNPGVKKPSDTTLSICNDTASPFIDVAMASYQDESFVSQGWWRVQRGSCWDTKLVDKETGRPKRGNVMLTAISPTNSYGYGAEEFCFGNRQKFRFENADSRNCKGHHKMKTAEVPVSPGKPTRFSFHE